LIAEIRKELRQSGDEELAARLQRFFKTGKGEYGEGDRFLGIKVPILRKIARKYRSISIDDAYGLLSSQYHEERFFSLVVLVDIFKKADNNDKNTIYKLYLKNTKYINNWDLVDVSAGKIVDAYLFDREKEPLYKLARSNVIWERRISIIATSYFINQHKFEDTINIAEILLRDKEDLIHKAVGWMLREVGNRTRDIEEDFLLKHHKSMPRTMLRYAIEKFPEEKRKHYLQGF